MKKFNLFLGSLMGLAITVTGVAAVATGFPDVPTEHWASQAILNLKTAGVLQGYTDGTFGPNKTVTRAEASVMIDKNNAVWMKKMEAMQKEMAEIKTMIDVPAIQDPTVLEPELKTYSNAALGFNFEHSEEWKMNVYNKQNTTDFYALALDPTKVLTEAEYWSIDTFPGLVHFRIDPNVTQVVGWDDFSTVKIGKNDAVTAKKSEIAKMTNSPNGTWEGKHVITYYINRPNTAAEDDLVIQYVSDQTDVNLEDFEAILDSLVVNQ